VRSLIMLFAVLSLVGACQASPTVQPVTTPAAELTPTTATNPPAQALVSPTATPAPNASSRPTPAPTATPGPTPKPIAAVARPDGRIRLAATGYPGKVKPMNGPFVGNNVYNATGAHQTDTEAWYSGDVAGSYYKFDISIQNDGNKADRFKVMATGTATTGWTVEYLHGTTNITSAVVVGTYRTPSVAPGATYVVTVKLTITLGADVTRLVTITSVADATKKDAVKLVLKFVACGC
jgi:hypothetical protein